MRHDTWLLIANASKARLYSFCRARFIQSPDSKDLSLKEEREHVDSRKKGKDLSSGKPSLHGKGALVEPNPKEHEAVIFAKNLAEELDNARKQDDSCDFIIAAPPFFLGLLKKNLNDSFIRKASFIEKDYTSHEGKQLVADLMDHL